MSGSVFVLRGVPGCLARQWGAPVADAVKAGALAGVPAYATHFYIRGTLLTRLQEPRECWAVWWALRSEIRLGLFGG